MPGLTRGRIGLPGQEQLVGLGDDGPRSGLREAAVSAVLHELFAGDAQQLGDLARVDQRLGQLGVGLGDRGTLGHEVRLVILHEGHAQGYGVALHARGHGRELQHEGIGNDVLGHVADNVHAPRGGGGGGLEQSHWVFPSDGPECE